MEIDQKSHGNIRQANMGKQLSVVNRVQCVFALRLYHDSVFHDQVGSKAAIKLYVFVDQRDGFLTFHLHAQLLQFVGEAGFVCGLQQPWP